MFENVNGRMHGRMDGWKDDGQKVIKIAHPEYSSGKLIKKKWLSLFANSEGPYQMLPSAASDLGLFSSNWFRDSHTKWFNTAAALTGLLIVPKLSKTAVFHMLFRHYNCILNATKTVDPDQLSSIHLIWFHRLCSCDQNIL